MHNVPLKGPFVSRNGYAHNYGRKFFACPVGGHINSEDPCGLQGGFVWADGTAPFSPQSYRRFELFHGLIDGPNPTGYPPDEDRVGDTEAELTAGMNLHNMAPGRNVACHEDGKGEPLHLTSQITLVVKRLDFYNHIIDFSIQVPSDHTVQGLREAIFGVACNYSHPQRRERQELTFKDQMLMDENEQGVPNRLSSYNIQDSDVIWTNGNEIHNWYGSHERYKNLASRVADLEHKRITLETEILIRKANTLMTVRGLCFRDDEEDDERFSACRAEKEDFDDNHCTKMETRLAELEQKCAALEDERVECEADTDRIVDISIMMGESKAGRFDHRQGTARFFENCNIGSAAQFLEDISNEGGSEKIIEQIKTYLKKEYKIMRTPLGSRIQKTLGNKERASEKAIHSPLDKEGTTATTHPACSIGNGCNRSMLSPTEHNALRDLLIKKRKYSIGSK